ncbi:MAG: ribokinase [Verrucomicrobiota bacterium]
MHSPAPNTKPRILVIGSLNVDLVIHARRFPEPGETVAGESFQRFFGGKGANQAVAAARAGAAVTFIGATGDDELGQAAREQMAGEGIDMSRCKTDQHANTGVALITIDQSGENSIVVVSGANGSLRAEDIDGIDWESYQAVLLQLEIPIEVVNAAIDRGQGKVPIFLTPAPLEGSIDETMLAKVDFLIPNEHEASHMRAEKPAPQAARELSRIVSQGVALTLGGQGAQWISRKDDGKHAPAPPVSPIDTVGAGDCFSGYFAQGIASGLDPIAAMGRAVRAAALKVTRPGAQDGIPFATELDR